MCESVILIKKFEALFKIAIIPMYFLNPILQLPVIICIIISSVENIDNVFCIFLK